MIDMYSETEEEYKELSGELYKCYKNYHAMIYYSYKETSGEETFQPQAQTGSQQKLEIKKVK